MRAAMSALATVHATGYGYQESCGGRKAFLERYPIIKDQNRLPKFSEMKVDLTSDFISKFEKHCHQYILYQFSQTFCIVGNLQCSHNTIFSIHESSST